MLDDGRIAIVARGRAENETCQISGLILYYKVVVSETGEYKLAFDCQQRVFPSIFSRQLDFAAVIKDQIVITIDTADEEKHEAFSISTVPKDFRSDGISQKHFRHIFSDK